MIAIVTLLVAFPAGFWVRGRLAAFVVYLGAYAWAFTFQGVYLMRSWVGGDHSAFAADPDRLPVGYAVVSLGIYAVGLGLVALGHLVRTRLRARRSAAAPADA